MDIFEEIQPLKRHIKKAKFEGKTIGFVPTMGALHEGHLSLIRASKKSNDLTVCSIYVNPTQFNNSEDLEKYPKTLDNDLNLLEEEGCEIVFCPNDQSMYNGQNGKLEFKFGHLESTMEGKFRPGHFNGVALIVSKFFNILQPDKAYFGQKDLQQFLVIEQVVKNLYFDLELVCIPILRESNGLAMSSRNMRIALEDKEKALLFYKALIEAKRLIMNKVSVAETKLRVEELFKGYESVQLEYFHIVDGDTLEEKHEIRAESSEKVAFCIAGYVGQVRLIDNMFLN
ncbi:MAG: pantoate--beta-alanine ligase [Bacteroidota bacterium]